MNLANLGETERGPCFGAVRKLHPLNCPN